MGVVEKMRERIHKEGKDADGSQIGTYSKGYMKVRTGEGYKDYTYKRDFKGKDKKTGEKIDRKKGDVRPADVFVSGKDKHKPRPKYNRSDNDAVIASLTRSMENSLTVILLANGAGIGYHDELNYNKSQWVEKTYNKEGKIFVLTSEERDLARECAEEMVLKLLGS